MLRWLVNRLQDRAATLGAAAREQMVPAPTAHVVREPSPQDKVRAEELYQQANLAQQRGQAQSAERLYREALRANPRFSLACANLGALLRDVGNVAEAEKYLIQAVEAQPGLAPAHFNLAMIRIDQTRWRDAAGHLRQSLLSDPKQADAQYWLGNALMGLGDAAASRKAYHAAIRLDPNYVQPRWGLVVAQLPAIPQDATEQAKAVDRFASEFAKLRAWLRAPRAVDTYLAVGAQQPYYLAYIAGNHKAILADYGRACANLMATWARKVGVPAPVPASGAKIRVGIVSAHVRNHSVWQALVRGWLEHLDPNRFEIHLFHTGKHRDKETDWAESRVALLQAQGREWTQWAKSISDSRLDALIYPELGMDSTTIRLAALRLARVQLAAWGHPITTGLPTMDGYISAQALEPANGAEHYTETLYPLPGLGSCYRAYQTQPGQPDFTTWRIQDTDKVLLCAGTPFKYSPKHDAVWLEIARQCQPCKLVFFGSEADDHSKLLEQRLRNVFRAGDLDFDQVVRFVPWQTQPNFFAFLDRADVFLDTPDFSGFNTVMQAVERGTPVVAYEGALLRGRFASANLGQLELTGWIARSPEEFVQIAVQLAFDRSARQRMRQAVDAHRQELFEDKSSVDALGQLLQTLCAK